MANLVAYQALAMNNMRFNRIFEGAYYSNLIENTKYNNNYYSTLLEIDWSNSGSNYITNLGGYNITYVTDYQTPIIMAGTITGFYQFSANGKNYGLDYLIEGMNVSAPLFGSLLRSINASDHIAALKLALSGQDNILGSSYADILYSYDGNDSITGGSGADILYAGTGDDVLTGGEGNDSLYGEAGVDIATYSERSNKYQIIVNSNGITVNDRTGREGTDTLNTDIELIGFVSDQRSLVSDYFIKTSSLTQSAISSLAELYIASFNRAPDVIGLSYWGSRLKDGMTLNDIAKSFFVQPETIAAYPASQGTDVFVSKVYNNVLGRSPDKAGLKYWTDDLTSGVISRDIFLLAIINGAKAPSGGAEDKATLSNKTKIGLDFSVQKGLNNTTWASDVMADVNASLSSVDIAKSKINFYSTSAETGSAMELTIKVGHWDFI